jgi:Cu2+-containing amine oxidase
MNGRCLVVLSLIVSLVAGACVTAARTPSAEAAADFTVSADEREQAVGLAEGTRDFKSLTVEQPVYLIDVDVFRDKEVEEAGDEGSRQILVTHYAAGTDAAVLTRVDLAENRVVDVETVPHLPVRLSQEEFEMAKRLALEDPRVAAALRGQDVEVEAQLSRTADENDPQYRHRVVHFLFKTPNGYLDEPIVYVDLTARQVVVE